MRIFKSLNGSVYRLKVLVNICVRVLGSVGLRWIRKSGVMRLHEDSSHVVCKFRKLV